LTSGSPFDDLDGAREFMNFSRVLFSCAIASLLLGLAPRMALAQTRPSIDVRTWRPSSDPRAGLVLEPVSTSGPWQWNIGAWVHYAQSPVVLRDPTTSAVNSRPLDHVLGSDLVAGMGLGAGVAIGVSVPIFLWQDGTSSLPPTVVGPGAVPTTGLGDMGLHGKVTVLSNDRQGIRAGPGLAALTTVTLPTGARSSFAADGSVTTSLILLGEYAVGVGAVRAEVGFKLRTDHHMWPDDSVAGVTFGDEIPWSTGVVFRPKALAQALDTGDRQEWEIALHGSLPAGPVAPFGLGTSGASSLSPVLLALADRVALGRYRDATLIAGGDFGLDNAVGTPVFRALVSLGWAPQTHDRDGDGVADDIDECPDLPEDRDGIQDSDGCPEDDADGDGVLDTEDACPLEPGVWWNNPRKNGCPAPDTDGDGISDPVDACPAVKGAASPDSKKNGCPPDGADRDHDGIPDDADKCPDVPEDQDGYEDFDGCPETDPRGGKK
jgi:hypothetical protein